MPQTGWIKQHLMNRVLIFRKDKIDLMHCHSMMSMRRQLEIQERCTSTYNAISFVVGKKKVHFLSDYICIKMSERIHVKV